MSAERAGSVVIRPERPGEAAGVRAVMETAFAGRLEADLVDRLRADGAIILSLVADQQDDLAGCIVFPRLVLEESGRSHPVVGLAPLAVMPATQRRGIGGALIEEGLSILTRQGEQLVFVLGDPAYYGRFGFDPAPGGYESVYAGPYFMVRRLRDGAPCRGRLRYPAAFDDLA